MTCGKKRRKVASCREQYINCGPLDQNYSAHEFLQEAIAQFLQRRRQRKMATSNSSSNGSKKRKVMAHPHRIFHLSSKAHVIANFPGEGKDGYMTFVR